MNGCNEDTFRAEIYSMAMLNPKDSQSNLFFVADKDKTAPHIRIALEQAERYHVDAVFFRIFPIEDNRAPIPQIYIYYNTSISLDEVEYAQRHRRLWNAGIVPLVFIMTAGQIRILNCRQSPDISNISQEPVFTPFHTLEKVVAADRSFAAREVAAGTLWEDATFKNDFALEKTAYHKLLTHLKSFRKELLSYDILTEPTANRVLVMAILVKYLNDRQDSAGNRVFEKGFLSQFSQANNDDIESIFREPGGCTRLFDQLSIHFNGGIFELTDNEREELNQADLSAIAEFLKGDQEPHGQRLFWPLYSFEDLPVELISNIYEEFLAKKGDSKGIVYTPPMLVDFLIDQCLPIESEKVIWKILDPACGSGVFLVGAFKRLIQCWRMANDWKRPTYHDLQSILKNSIYGIDKAPEAVLVTAFSLCVALCDELEPLIIWNELKFDDLRIENLQAKDFFEIVDSGEINHRFDLVIGNPPFNSKLTTDSARRIEKSKIQDRPSLPYNQLALLFLEQSFRVAKKNATVCLIQPAGPLLYNGQAQDFRRYLFEQFAIGHIFDFTPLEGILFPKAQVAAAAVIGVNASSTNDKIQHVVFRRTTTIKEKLLFELDPYDFHWVPRKAVTLQPYVWKINLLGGGRLHRMMEMVVRVLNDAPTLGEYLLKKQENDDWQFGEGYSVGVGRKLNELTDVRRLTKLTPKELMNRFNLKRTPKTAPWITGKPDIPPEDLTRKGIDWRAVEPTNKLFFERTREAKKLIFSAPHVLIREMVDGVAIPAVYTEKELVFTNQIIGVHAPENEKGNLEVLAKRLNESKLYGILAILLSGRILVGRSNSLYKSDVMALPYPPNMEDIKLNFWEKALVDDIDNYLVDFRRKGEKAYILNTTDESDLHEFGEFYCRVLNSVYEEFCPLKPIRIGSFICYPFCYGDATRITLPENEEIVPFLEELLHRRYGNRLFLNRILRMYEQNIIFMVKPDQKRYWLRSIALRDADETLIDLLEQGY